LKKTYYNVKKIKLVSSEFPNTELLIKEVPDEQKNNSLYWQILDDGNHIYSVNINSGNYDSQSLQSELVDKISKLLLKNTFLISPSLIKLELKISVLKFIILNICSKKTIKKPLKINVWAMEALLHL
jgi:hypothetical protein